MKHPSYVAGCGICEANAGENAIPGGIVFENELWLIRHAGPQTRCREDDAAEPAARVGGRRTSTTLSRGFWAGLRHFERVLEKVTGALRIYRRRGGRAFPPLPRAHDSEVRGDAVDAKAMAVFDLPRRARRGRIKADEAEVERITVAYREALKKEPPPG